MRTIAKILRMREDSKKCSLDVESQYVELAAEVFRLLADPTRVRIVLVLRDGEHAVGDLADRVGKPATVVSQHLAKLRWGRVVVARQDGTRVYYRLVDERVRQLVATAVRHAEGALEPESAHQRAGVSQEPAEVEGPRGERA